MFGQLAFRVQDTRVPSLGRTPEADVNRTAQVRGGLASNPDNSESQVQVETLDRQEQLVFLLGAGTDGSLRSPFPERQQRAPESTARPGRRLTILTSEGQNTIKKFFFQFLRDF